MFVSRRQFLHQSMLAATATAATGTGEPLVVSPRIGPNGKLGAAVIGTGGRGSAQAAAYTGRQACEVKYLCDADLARAQSLFALGFRSMQNASRSLAARKRMPC